MISSHIDDINEDKRYKTYKEIIKEDQVFADYKVKCKCSHTVIMPYRHKRYYATSVVVTYIEIKKTNLKID